MAGENVSKRPEKKESDEINPDAGQYGVIDFGKKEWEQYRGHHIAARPVTGREDRTKKKREAKKECRERYEERIKEKTGLSRSELRKIADERGVPYKTVYEEFVAEKRAETATATATVEELLQQAQAQARPKPPSPNPFREGRNPNDDW